MSSKQRGMIMMFTLVLMATLVSACTQSLSTTPATPTVIPTGLFVSPIASFANPMDQIAEFAKQTAVAQTLAAGGVVVTGTPGTPGVVPQVTVAGTVITPQTGGTPSPAAVTPTNANAAVATTAAPAVATTAPNATPVPAGSRPASYTLQAGEFPYCIARRFNVDPDALLAASGLTSPDLYYPGLTLKIPQSGAFPGQRMLASHPATYTVASSDETIYGIACKYGDVDPSAIASANGISAGASLTAGQQIKIP